LLIQSTEDKLLVVISYNALYWLLVLLLTIVI